MEVKRRGEGWKRGSEEVIDEWEWILYEGGRGWRLMWRRRSMEWWRNGVWRWAMEENKGRWDGGGVCIHVRMCVRLCVEGYTHETLQLNFI